MRGSKPGERRGGRKKGTPNKGTAEAREICANLLDADYLKDLKTRLQAGKLAPHVEALLWHYAYGKPTEHVALENPDGGPVEVRFVLVGGQS